jgi:hypothetical protein
MRTLLTLLLLTSALFAFGQKKKKQDREAIKSMCGCYEVTFEFAETFSPDKDYEFHENYKSGGLEWVELLEDEPDKISMQHLLIVGNGAIVKHWRQDWLYQNTELYSFYKDRTWHFTELPKNEVKGQWTQKVFQVDDGLRYEGSGSWVHMDGKHYWENTSFAPLPRREFSKRNDYNVMRRKNRHELTSYGWLHEQDNDKILRTEADDKIIAREKGWNTYKKVDDARCRAAQDWWAGNNRYWGDVREVWAALYDTKSTLSFAGRIDKKALFDHLFALGDELAESADYESEAVQQQIKEIINIYHK